MSGLYLVWRCADLNGRQPVVSFSPQNRGVWRQGACSACGEPVWYQHLNLNRRSLVCWPCGDAIGVAA